MGNSCAGRSATRRPAEEQRVNHVAEHAQVAVTRTGELPPPYDSRKSGQTIERVAPTTLDVFADDSGPWATRVVLDNGVSTDIPKCSASTCQCDHKLPIPIVILADGSLMVTCLDVCPLDGRRAVKVTITKDQTDPICLLCNNRSRDPLVIQEVKSVKNAGARTSWASLRCVECLRRSRFKWQYKF